MIRDYEKHSADKRCIWRYLDFTKYLSLLDTCSLFLPRCDMFHDKYEGYYPNIRSLLGKDYKPTITNRNGLWGRSDTQVSEKEGLQLAVYELRQRSAVSCWHLNDGESEAMWKLYLQSLEGVAIVTRISGLTHALAASTETFVFGDVEYVAWDDESKWPTDTVSPFFRKRPGFAHESEFRTVLQRSEPIEAPGVTIQLSHVDVETLVERVVISPTAPSWFSGLVRSVTAKLNFDFEIAQSELAALPDWGDAERVAAIRESLKKYPPGSLVVRKHRDGK